MKENIEILNHFFKEHQLIVRAAVKTGDDSIIFQFFPEVDFTIELYQSGSVIIIYESGFKRGLYEFHISELDKLQELIESEVAIEYN